METNILVVDDETAIADLVEVYLKNEGYTGPSISIPRGRRPGLRGAGRTWTWPSWT